MTVKYVFNPFTGTFDAVTATLSPGDITGGTPNTFAGWDSTGTLESIPSWNISTVTGGAEVDINLAPNDSGATTFYIENFNNVITPTVDLNASTFNGLNNTSRLAGAFAFTNGHTGLTNTVVTQDTGFKGGVVGIRNTVALGDNVGPDTSQDNYALITQINLNNGHTANGTTISDNSININTGTTVTNVGGYNLSINIDGTVNNNVNANSINFNVTSPQTANFNGHSVNGNISNTISSLDSFNTNVQLQSGAATTGGIDSFTDGTHLYSGSTIAQSVTSFGSFVQVDSGASVNSLNGYLYSPTVVPGLPGNGSTAFGASGQWAGTMNYWNCLQASPSMNSGLNIVDSYNFLSDNSQWHSGSTVNNLTPIGIFPNVESGATVTEFTGLAMGPQFNASIPDVQLASLNISGSGTVTNLVGLNIDLSAIPATNRKVGINLNSGVVNFNSVNTTQSSIGIDSLNTIVPTLTIQSGSPITGTTIFANNMSSLIDVEDNIDGGALGMSVAGVGFVGQLNVAAGKTMAGVSWALAGSQVSGSGTITDYTCYDALGAIPTASTIITNLYAFRGHSFLSAAGPANVWGVSIEDASAENFFQKSLAIGTSSKKVTNSSTALEIGGTTTAFRNAVLTTTQETALTPLSGMQVFNSTTGALEYYNGSAWVAPIASTVGNLTSTPTTNLVVTGGTGAVLGTGTLLTLTGASLVESTSSVLTITGATNAVLGTGVSIQVKQAGTSQSGYLSSTDWNTFNGKQAAGNYITALTGDATASGPGSAAITLSTVNSNVGSFTNANITVNAKGLITAASSGASSSPITRKAIFTSSTTWTTDPTITPTTVVKITSVGGGGSGGAGAATTGGGGGGGGGGGAGASVAWVTGTTFGASQVITIGTGGSSGSNGTSTSVGALSVASGGNSGGAGGSSGITGSPGASGVGTTGDILLNGTSGDAGIFGIAGVLNGPGGTGGASAGEYGGGGGGGGPISTGTGGSAISYGGGGGGGGSNGAGSSGGSGANGVVVIEWIG